MSIPNIIDKIKRKISIDKITLFYLFIIMGVGISSFGLGRLSLTNSLNDYNNIGIKGVGDIIIKEEIKNDEAFQLEVLEQKEKRYVASKNGKMYYTLDCSGAKRIKEENQIWFSSKEDAEKSGFVLSSTCK